jgi:hypothetical protein
MHFELHPPRALKAEATRTVGCSYSVEVQTELLPATHPFHTCELAASTYAELARRP